MDNGRPTLKMAIGYLTTRYAGYLLGFYYLYLCFKPCSGFEKLALVPLVVFLLSSQAFVNAISDTEFETFSTTFANYKLLYDICVSALLLQIICKKITLNIVQLFSFF